MTVDELLAQVRQHPESVEFDQVMKVIDDNYEYQPTPFKNGEIINEAGKNECSCKVFYFAQLNKLSEAETLALFGSYYRDDVMGNPAGEDHLNIRNFILDGWTGVRFAGEALTAPRLH
ncbi:HopJ type III effector protein [Gilvimarinus sp. F26214L]|uniref:HopJ type III effector protein n=1 Tax=Gilvimarinus sp. DZF01 TaxID=3461371 RepID=UPI004045AF56